MHTFQVEQQHIDAGVPKAVLSCPLALAIYEADGAPSSKRVTVDGTDMYLVVVSDDHIVYRGERYITTVAIDEWIKAFDDGQEVAPFELILDGVIADIRSKGVTHE